jgi:hypothetical protein
LAELYAFPLMPLTRGSTLSLGIKSILFEGTERGSCFSPVVEDAHLGSNGYNVPLSADRSLSFLWLLDCRGGTRLAVAITNQGDEWMDVIIVIV